MKRSPETQVLESLLRNLVLQALEDRRPSHVHVAWFP